MSISLQLPFNKVNPCIVIFGFESSWLHFPLKQLIGCRKHFKNKARCLEFNVLAFQDSNLFSLYVSPFLFSHMKTGSKGQDYTVEWEFKVKLDVSICHVEGKKWEDAQKIRVTFLKAFQTICRSKTKPTSSDVNLTHCLPVIGVLLPNLISSFQHVIFMHTCSG